MPSQMENNWGLSLCGRTDIPEERQEEATGEGIALVAVECSIIEIQVL